MKNSRIPHAVVCHITEKNSTIEELDQLIKLLKSEHNFMLIGGPSYNGKKIHLGTTLVKNISGDNTESIFVNAKNELEGIETGNISKFACRLTAVAIDSVSEGIFID